MNQYNSLFRGEVKVIKDDSLGVFVKLSLFVLTRLMGGGARRYLGNSI